MNRQSSAPGLYARTRRRAALIAALTLPLSMMSAPVIAQNLTPSPTPTTSPPSAPATPTNQALAKAKKDNRRIEIESLQSETTTYYANPDGKTLRMEQHLQPIRVKNAKGDGFTPVDTTLVETDGVIKPKTVKGDLTLSAGDDAFVLKSKGIKGTATIGSPGKLPKPTIDGSTATYPSVYGKGIDLVVTATATGFKQEIVLRERITGQASFRIPTTVPKNMALDKDTAGKPALLSEGKKIADLPPALLLDSVATNPNSDIDAGKVGQATVTLDKSASALVYTPDPAYLADPAVAYPVTLAAFDDDWWEPDLGNDTFVNNADYPNGYANSGLDRILVGKSNSGAVRWRSYIRFDEFTADHPIRGATVQNADLVLWNHLSSDCGLFVGSGITAYRVTERWDVTTLTWGSQPRVTLTGADTEYAGYAGENCTGSMNYPWDLIHSVDDIVQAWADGEPNYGFQLTAGNESDLRNWRRYRTNEAGGCTTAPRQNCLGTLHPPFLTVDFEPVSSFFIASWTYTDEEEIDTYEEAIAAYNDPGRVRAYPSITTRPAISWEEAYEQKVSSTESLITTADELLNGPQPEESPPPIPDPDVDTTPPQVVAVTPSEAAVDVSVDTQVTVTFSEPVTDAQISLTDRLNEEQVSGSTVMSADNKVLTFTPAQPLTETYYTAEAASAKDAAGNVIAAPYTWQFTTTVQVPEPTPTPTPVPGLVTAYGMNEGSGTSVADSSGQNNTGTGSSTNWVNGKYGKALSFDGSSSWVTVPHAESLRLTTGMTLSAWVNPSTVADWSSVVGKELNEGVSYTLYAATDFSAPGGWVQTSPDDSSYVDALEPLQVNTWSHLALTYDNTALRLFVDGQQVAQTALSGSLFDDGSPLRIGGNDFYGEYFRGLIDEVRIYNRAQSAAEIQADMNTPIGSTTPDPDPTPTPTPTPDPTPNPVPGLVAAYGMEEGSGTTVGDSSGQHNTGAARDTTWATGKHGKALSFNGSSSWVTVQHAASLRLRNALTLSAWVRPSALDGWRTVLMKEHSWGGAYGLYASIGTGPAGWLETDDDAGGSASSNLLPLNQWSHLAVTYNGSLVRLYVNGTQVAQAPLTGELIDDGGRLRIGGNAAWGEFYRGLIDEVRVYNRAQTATEIQTDMNTPIGAAAAGVAARKLQQSSASQIQKLVVDDGRRVDGVTVTSHLTPNLTAWLRAGRDGEAKVEVEIAGKPTKSFKANKATTDKRLIWSGEVTAKPDDTRVSLQVPQGHLRNGEKVRWRARLVTGQQTGPWADWQSMLVESSSPSTSEPTQSQDFTATATLTPPLAVNEHPRMTPAQCESNRAQAKRTTGWTMNRYSWCVIGKFSIQEIRGHGQFATIATRFESEIMIIGYTFNGLASLRNQPGEATSRNIILDLHAKVITVHPLVASYTLKLGAMPADDQCEHVTRWNGLTHHNNIAKRLGQWATGDTYRFHLQCPAANAKPKRTVVWDQDDEYIVSYDNEEEATLGRFIVYGDYPDMTPLLPNGFRYVLGTGNKEAGTFIQCDSADYIAQSGGCVFGDVVSSVQHELGQGYDAAYKHYWNACYAPDDTYPILLKLHKYPAVKKKDIQGCLDPAKNMKYNNLHRIDDGAAESNRGSITRPECNWLWGSRTGGSSGNDCDEFPYASTWERWNNPYPGANLTRAGYSLCPIPLGENRRAGSLLTIFYGKERILHGDPFFVRFKTQLDDPPKCMAPIPGHN